MARFAAGLILSLLLLAGCGASPRPELDLTAPPVPSPVSRVLDTAMAFVGAPYRYGGTSRDGFDCSGLTTVSFEAAGVRLPRRARDQSTVGRPVNRAELRRGDLVFFSSGRRSGIDHVGIVRTVEAGRVTFVHATARSGVRVDRLDAGYWRDRYVTARRISLR